MLVYNQKQPDIYKVFYIIISLWFREKRDKKWHLNKMDYTGKNM